MAAKKRLTKSQLRDDKFIDTVAHYAGILRENLQYFMGGLILILIVVIAVSWGFRHSQGADMESRLAFTQALKGVESALASSAAEDYERVLQDFETIGEQYGSKEVGRWSLYYTGYCREQLMRFPEAQADYEAYLEADGGGEFALSARQGIASCLYSMNKPRPAAELFEELAGGEKVSDAQRLSWLYRAGRIYLEGQYYEESQRVLEALESEAKGTLLTQVTRDLATLRALRS